MTFDARNSFCSRLTSAICLYAQVQFHAKYPLIGSQSDREFTFSYAILQEMHLNPLDTQVINPISVPIFHIKIANLYNLHVSTLSRETSRSKNVWGRDFEWMLC